MGPLQDTNSSRTMRSYLPYGQPDLVVFGGDYITRQQHSVQCHGKSLGGCALPLLSVLLRGPGGQRYWNMLLQLFLEVDASWAMVWGGDVHRAIRRPNIMNLSQHGVQIIDFGTPYKKVPRLFDLFFGGWEWTRQYPGTMIWIVVWLN